MNKWILEYLWLYPDRKRVTIEAPGWDDVKTAIDQMDGFHLDNVYLISQTGDFLGVFGGHLIDEEDEWEEYKGKRLYSLSQFLDHGNGGQMILRNREVWKASEEEYWDELIQLSVEGQGTDVETRYVVEYDAVIKAFQYYYETGELTKDQIWEVL